MRLHRVVVTVLMVALLAGCGPPPTPLDEAAREGREAVEACEDALMQCVLARNQGRITDAEYAEAATLYQEQATPAAELLGSALHGARIRGDTALAEPGTAAAIAAQIRLLRRVRSQLTLIAKGDR